MPQHVAHLPRTGFDMSQSFAFTSSTGMILPVYQDILNVGETVYLNGSLFARTQPLVNASMADVDVYLDWFFVPIPMLYQLFPSIRYQTNDYFSSVFNSELESYGSTLPLTDINAMMDEIQTITGTYSADTKDAFTGGVYGSDFDCLGKSIFRLLNHVGFNPFGIVHGDTTPTAWPDNNNPTVFPLFLMSYQAIFQDYFRIEDYERRSVLCFNADNQYDQQSQPTHQFNLASGLCQLRYRPRHKDYFTSVKGSPLTSAINLLNSDNTSVSTILSRVDNFLDSRTVFTGGVNALSAFNPIGFAQGSNPYDNTEVGQYYNNSLNETITSTGVIRSMFAAEKLLRIIGRSKKDYDSQVLAHFGYKVPHDVKHQLSHLFEQHALLHIGEVVGTADTFDSGTGEGSALGAVSGKGYINIPQRQQAYKFTAPVDGVIMCVYSSVPRFRYYNTFDKQNAITSRLDFFTPEFDKLGMQPLYSYEADIAEIGTAKRLGWQYRYQQHKQKYDRVSEAFRIGNNDENYYSSWVLAHDSFLNFAYSTGNFYPPLADSFYVAPTDLNSIMQMKYSPAWSSSYVTFPWEMFDTDPFINDFKASVKKVSTMSTTGEPDL